MKFSDIIRKRIKYYLDDRNMSIWSLCRLTGIPCSTLSTFMNSKTKLIKLDTLLLICERF